MWFPWTLAIFWWILWFYPLIVRAPHVQKRPSITVVWPTRAGLLLESLAVFLAFAFRIDTPPNRERIAAAMILGAVAAVLSWTSVTHLGRQFRIHAGLYEDHELVVTGPYAVVRLPPARSGCTTESGETCEIPKKRENPCLQLVETERQQTRAS